MTKMASCLFRSRDIFIKCPLIAQPKNCTNCIKWCESQKIKRISSKCCCEVVPIWENNTTSIRTSCWHGRNTQYTYHAYNQGNPGQKSQTTYHSHITETKCVCLTMIHRRMLIHWSRISRFKFCYVTPLLPLPPSPLPSTLVSKGPFHHIT